MSTGGIQTAPSTIHQSARSLTPGQRNNWAVFDQNEKFAKIFFPRAGKDIEGARAIDLVPTSWQFRKDRRILYWGLNEARWCEPLLSPPLSSLPIAIFGNSWLPDPGSWESLGESPMYRCWKSRPGASFCDHFLTTSSHLRNPFQAGLVVLHAQNPRVGRKGKTR